MVLLAAVLSCASATAVASAAAARGSPAVSPDPAGADVVLRLLAGTWSLRSATVNGRTIPDRKFASGTWTFSGRTLSATNGEGEGARFTLAVDAAAPGAIRLEGVPPSKERGGWMIFRREGDRLALAFFDGFSGRPEDFAPAPEKVILILERGTGKATR